jgi:CheY-like chemotaxis protein
LSLTGNLEDLPLLDILQIVSFSKKTGYLGITTSAGDGAIVFRDGFVVAGFAWEQPPLPARFASLAQAQRQPLIRKRIEMSLEQLIRLREGQFHFSLSDATPKAVGSRDISGETLEDGINPQELLLDLARGMDEDRRDSSEALEASFQETPAAAAAEALSAEPSEAAAPALPELPEHVPLSSLPPEYTVPLHAIPEAMLKAATAAAAAPPAPAPAAAPAPAVEAKALLLVDDEEDVRRILAQVFTRGGYQVVEAEDPDAAVKKASRLSKAGIEFVLVTDLGMPTSGGSSFQGGFEVVKRLVKMKLDPPVLMMTETLSQAVRARAKQMGIESFVFKPSLSKLDPEQHKSELQAFADELLREVIPTLKKRGLAGPAAKAAAPPAPAAAGGSRDLRALQQYLGELEGSPDATRISTLVMKVAREFFERAVLFLIKQDEVRGLGGFGSAGSGENINLIARELTIPLSQPSIFLDVVSSGKPWHGTPPEGKWSRYLTGRLGRFRSGEVALVPLVAHRDTIAILFGDNPETGRAPERLEAFFLFVHQAGIAMENALLQRKLRAMQEKG